MRASALRLGLGVGGVVVAGYGGWLLVGRQDPQRLVNVAEWVVAGILLHDAVLAPVVVVAGAICARRLPAVMRGLLARVLILLGPVTLIAVPVLFGGGGDPTNPTIDGRDYLRGWGIVALGCVVVAGTMALKSDRTDRRDGRSSDGTGHDRRR